MTPHEINNAIDALIDPANRLRNYHGSMDACAEFERSLSAKESDDYVDTIEMSLIANGESRRRFGIATATAPQRCEAYLKTKNLWREAAK